MVLPTDEIKQKVDRIAAYASAFADYDEVSFLVELNEKLDEELQHLDFNE